MLIPSFIINTSLPTTSLSRRVNANSQHADKVVFLMDKLIKKGEC